MRPAHPLTREAAGGGPRAPAGSPEAGRTSKSKSPAAHSGRAFSSSGQLPPGTCRMERLMRFLFSSTSSTVTRTTSPTDTASDGCFT